jgi:RNA polymerase sigma-70 factor (ECF subfamily)
MLGSRRSLAERHHPRKFRSEGPSAPETAAGGRAIVERNGETHATLATSIPWSFNEIYTVFFGHVHRWTRALGAPAAEREDLVQDVFVVVHRRLPDFDGENVVGWLYQITRRRVRDFRRRHWMRLFLSSPPEESLVSSVGGPYVQLEDRQRDATLLHLVSKLPEVQRAAFVLFEIDGYSGEEIARLQDAPINTVWARIRKARTKLAAEIRRLERRG